MKAVILNGLDIKNELYNDVKIVIEEELKKRGYKSNWVNLANKEIEHCTGCGYCSNKKPGLCIKNDDMQDIFPLMANSKFHIFLCPISFGGYNSELKKAVDRYGALGLPTYTVKHGELHHPMRYPNPVCFISIGVLSEEDKRQEETFKLVSERIAISCFALKADTVILNTNQENHTNIENLKRGFISMEVCS